MEYLKSDLQKKYETSRALIIGINKYKNAPPLSYAVNDAKEIQETLISELGFKKADIICLMDEKATREDILKAFLGFSNSNKHIKIDDCLFIFFAGRGHTIM